MTILVNAYAIGRKGTRIAPVPFELSGNPHTLRELICQCAEECVRRYNARAAAAEAPLGDDAVSVMGELGKIAFGMDMGGAPADVSKAETRALEAFEDGLVRVFLNGCELTEFDTPLCLRENDAVSFIRLVALAGRMW